MKNRRTLVLEDLPEHLKFIENLLNSVEGMQTDTTSDGKEALDMCRINSYDLVVTDPMMCGVDGIQFIQELAALHNAPALVLVSFAPQRMMTSVRLMAESLGLKVIADLPKPASPGDIADVMALLDDQEIVEHRTGSTEKLALDESLDSLCEAIANGHIAAWFQPKQSLESGRVTGAEALVRWAHPELGLVPPSLFLPLIEAHGIELELLRHVLRESIEAQKQWRRCGFRIPVSINLPTHLLERASLPEELLDLTLKLGGSAADLCFELMESSTTRHASDFYAGAVRLRMFGFGLAQDDFGQGLSSVHNLISTPFTEVKIDRALVQGCPDNSALQNVLSAVISLGLTLGMNIVAEGVETDDELDTLRMLGCTHVQGFLISAAIPSDSFIELLDSEVPAPKMFRRLEINCIAA